MFRFIPTATRARAFQFASSNTATSNSTARYVTFRTLSSMTTGKDRFFSQTDPADDIMMFRNSSSSTTTDATLNENISKSGCAFEKVAFLGTGKMAQAVIDPIINTGLQAAEKIAIFDVSVNQMKDVQAKHPNIVLADSIAELVDGADLVVCAVKPQNINNSLFNEFRKANIPDHATFLSVIAGLPLSTYYPTGYKKIVRSMPNTPAMIGRGMTVWCCTENMTVKERDVINTLLGCLGKTVRSVSLCLLGSPFLGGLGMLADTIFSIDFRGRGEVC